MKQKKQSSLIKMALAISFMVMIAVNALANALPIGGKDTGAISDAYSNLFAPQGLTFSIWGLIYMLLLLYSLYHVGLFRDSGKQEKFIFMDKIGILFIASSLINAAWIFAWHYEVIWLSLLLMFALLITLVAKMLNISKETLSQREKFFIRLPFSIYFGWITVATIANTTVWLVSSGWNGFGFSETFWMTAVLVVGIVIGIATMLRFNLIPYGLVFIWAYMGIWIKHLSPTGWNKDYPSIITTVILCIILLIFAEVFLLLKNLTKNE